MSILQNPAIKFLLIIPIIAVILFFGTNLMESDMSNSIHNRERILAQFAINYESMMAACSEDDLDPEELQSCFDAFDEVKKFCTIENADQCGDKQMEQLEQKLSGT